jgi:hypothetical protein
MPLRNLTSRIEIPSSSIRDDWFNLTAGLSGSQRREISTVRVRVARF